VGGRAEGGMAVVVRVGGFCRCILGVAGSWPLR